METCRQRRVTRAYNDFHTKNLFLASEIFFSHAPRRSNWELRLPSSWMRNVVLDWQDCNRSKIESVILAYSTGTMEEIQDLNTHAYMHNIPWDVISHRNITSIGSLKHQNSTQLRQPLDIPIRYAGLLLFNSRNRYMPHVPLCTTALRFLSYQRHANTIPQRLHETRYPGLPFPSISLHLHLPITVFSLLRFRCHLLPPASSFPPRLPHHPNLHLTFPPAPTVILFPTALSCFYFVYQLSQAVPTPVVTPTYADFSGLDFYPRPVLYISKYKPRPWIRSIAQ